MNEPFPSPETSSTANQALHIPEILHSILLQLPLQDLLVNAQLVSHDWHSAIKTSSRLQQALFLEPALGGDSQKLVFNPILQKAFPPWFQQPASLYSRGKVFTDLDWSQPDERRRAFMRKEASWRRMLPTQPAPHTLAVFKHVSMRRAGKKYQGEVEFPDGVRMATLYDFAYVTVAEPISSFLMMWSVRLEIDSENKTVPSSDGESCDVVTMRVNHTQQCNRGMPRDVGPEFRSEGFEELDIDLTSAQPRGSED
jgi:hypothetical protein